MSAGAKFSEFLDNQQKKKFISQFHIQLDSFSHKMQKESKTKIDESLLGHVLAAVYLI